ncbi:MAG: zinc-dependent alcohol dehydrogenase [Armatimonadota bacterium]
MKAVVLHEKEHLAVEEVPEPPLQRNEVMLRVTDCGICGSDIRYYHGENPWAQQTLGEVQENPPNIIPGHEVAGVVVRAGEGADEVLIGKRVAVLSFKVDETCYWCRRGERHLCPNTQHLGHGAGWGEQKYYYGGMAEYVPVWADHVFLLPDHVTTTQAAILDPLGVVVHAVERANVTPGESALVMGTGVLGLLAVQVLKAYGVMTLICADVDDRHLDAGGRLGADRTVNVANQELRDIAREMTDGIGVRVIVDSVGRPWEELLPVLARGGRLINLAAHDRGDTLVPMHLAGEKLVTTSANFKYEEYPIAMDLLYAGRVQAEPLITHRFPIAQAVEAFQAADHKQESGAIKVIINPAAVS